MLILRSIWVWGAAVVITVVLAAVSVVGVYLRFSEAFFDRMAHRWGSVILRISPVTVRVEGMQNVRLDEPQILASNHQSWYDVFVLAALIPKRYRFVAKQELEKIPLIGRAWVAAGMVSINRQDRSQAIMRLEQVGRLIREDKSAIVIFPEGTRSWTGELAPFKKGAVMVALNAHVDIVPVAIVGSRDILPTGDWRVRKGTIIVRFGEPLSTVGYNESNRDELVEVLRSRMQQLLEEPHQPGNDGEHVGDRQHSRT